MAGFLAIILVGLALALLLFELQYRQRQGNQLELDTGDWTFEQMQPERYRLNGLFTAYNRTRKLELMLPQVWAEATLLSTTSLDGISYKLWVTPEHATAEARPDGYWFGYIIKAQATTRLRVDLEIQGQDLSQLDSAWVRVHYVVYGPEGRISKTRHTVVPLKFPKPQEAPAWRETSAGSVLPIRTHLLTPLDTPVNIIQRYVKPYAQAGDVITFGETPIAIMQRRWRHPEEVRPGWLARRICYYFLPTSSLATACGMQTLVDVSGAWRVLWAFVAGAFAKKFLGKPGMFYQLAGEQAPLIDDVTGTLPPYDQFIVLGPDQPDALVDQVKTETGLEAAIVDVNDLKAVKILAATSGVSRSLLTQALIDNPAGNAAEQTPIVLIRPKTESSGA
ncbi:F420-0:Gamma-glutamyl ligase [Leptolyngbya sp. FACHB-261]|uniref:F420-0:Gamma-glutamyl ligase n=1 Tax=Leptolyngbya sp. FACHB-261 TaxID=2692806 RepID=UPI00168887F5|nr:F420-0:Gamma-glutamyl ligase [Leptolyngbya sp. FACHB-261]MBD2099404.1 F420-0:Gamma-glutamyl ligase [Leptolyngbya sp. FACHB-261]